jgi:hypothetical protein
MITITNNYFQDLNATLEAGIIAKVGGKNPKKADLYEAIAAYNAAATPEPVEVNPALDEVALQDTLLAMDAVEDAQKAEQQSNVKAMKKTRKLPQSEQAQKNAQDLATYRAIVEIKEAVGATKAAEQLTAQGRKMGGTTVCQIATTYYRVLMVSPFLQELFNDGLVTWGELYSRSRRINIVSIEAEFGTRLAQAS